MLEVSATAPIRPMQQKEGGISGPICNPIDENTSP
jgi:hypothetical protein